jgi:cytochrome c-type biogenesis protein CcmF
VPVEVRGPDRGRGGSAREEQLSRPAPIQRREERHVRDRCGFSPLALLLALAGFGAGIFAGRSRREDWTRVAERSVGVVFALVVCAIATLFYCFANYDYQLVYVSAHSARSMALHYRLAALWGGQAGSLLLWLFMLMAYSTAAVWSHRGRVRR